MVTTAELEQLAEETGRRISAAIERNGLTQRQVGEAIGVTGNAIAQIVRGKSTLQYAKLLLLCRRLGTTPNHILGIDEEPRARLIFKGACQGLFEGFQLPPEQADALAEVALRTFDMPVVSNDPQARARHIVAFQVQQYIQSKP